MTFSDMGVDKYLNFGSFDLFVYAYVNFGSFDYKDQIFIIFYMGMRNLVHLWRCLVNVIGI
jgi:hypothetical protein